MFGERNPVMWTEWFYYKLFLGICRPKGKDIECICNPGFKGSKCEFLSCDKVNPCGKNGFNIY